MLSRTQPMRMLLLQQCKGHAIQMRLPCHSSTYAHGSSKALHSLSLQHRESIRKACLK